MDADVLVCGLGPVGLLLANLLGARGIATVAFDAAPGPHDLPRAATIDDEVLRILQEIGLDDAVLEHAGIQRRVAFVTAAGRALEVLRPEHGRFGHPPLVSIHQPTLERTLLAGVGSHPSVRLEWGQRLEDLEGRPDHVRARLATVTGGASQELRAHWLVGADGARSAVRSLLGIPFEGSTDARPWLVVDATLDRPLRKVPHPRFVGDPARPAVTLPMSPRRHRWEFMLHRGEPHAAVTDPDRIRALIAPYLDGEQIEIERAVIYAFEARRAARWRAGRALLAGDAAHVMPPFAGQGYASGARDAANLAWKLEAVLAGAPERLMDSYEAERGPHVEAMARLAVRWGSVVQATRPGLARARDAVLGGVDGSPVGDRIRDVAKPAPTYRAGAFGRPIARVPWRRSTGSLFPQPSVVVAGRAVPLDDLLGRGWAALSRDAAARRALAAAGPAVWSPGADFDDPDGVVEGWLDRHACDWAVLRPDRFVFACGRARDLDSVGPALERTLGPARPPGALGGGARDDPAPAGNRRASPG